MPDLAPDGTPRAINLNSDTEGVRRALYDRIVLMQFSPVPAEDIGPGDYPGPAYGPDDAGLKVFHLYSRWFAVWTAIDEQGKSERLLTRVLRVTADPSSPFGLMLHEV